MAKIIWAESAIEWLNDIHNYIAERNPDAANRIVEGVHQKVQLLEDFPLIGYKYGDEAGGEIRILLHEHYRIAYLVQPDAVKVLGIFHGAMKLKNYLKGTTR